MTKKIVVAIGLFLIVERLPAQTTVDTFLYLSRQEMIDDLRVLREFVVANHPDAYYARSEEDIRDFSESLERSLPDSLSRIDFWRRCYQQITAYNDAHTRMRYTPFYRDYVQQGGTFFPLPVRFTAAGLQVTEDSTGVREVPQGSRLLAINGIGVDELKKELFLFARGESNQIDSLQVNDRFAYYVWLAYGWEGPFLIDYHTPGGLRKQINLPGISLDEWRLRTGWAPRPENVLQLKYLNDSTAYLYIRNLYSASKKGYKKAFDNVFERLRAKTGVKYLILDNQTNDGGDDTYAEYLCRYFADQPFRSAARSYWYVTPAFKETFRQAFIPKQLRWLRPLYIINPHTRAIWRAEDGELAEVKKEFTKPFPARKQFQGEVIFLSDVGTFSAGSMFAAMFKDFDMGTIIGRPTGNVSSFYANDIMRRYLPHSRLMIEVSTSYQVRPNGEENLRSIQPDIFVREGEDILEAALDWISQEQ